MTLAAGTRLDSYEIVAPLGAGSMGEVYRARDTALKRDAAIKVLPEYWSRDPERLHRFELEAQAAAALNHPNIVTIFHVGQYEGAPYIATELLHGETLRERIRHGPMRLREAIDVGVDSARGLAAAHDAGITHRDLKPENVFVTKDGRVKILDFGLAKLNPAKSGSGDDPTVTHPSNTSPGHVLGTVGYMSPEQVRGQAADARSDIFAAGAVLYEMLTGKRAFHKATAAETMNAILNEDAPAVSQVAPSVPPGLQRIVNRCLAKSPEQRIQHATDLAFALEALSDSGSTGMDAVKEQTSTKRWRWIAVGVAAIAAAAAIFVWWRVPPAVPVVESVTQLTDDGIPKKPPLVTDGSRIYFNEGPVGSLKIAQVSVAGGETSVVPTQLASPELAGIAPDGSSLLVLVGVLYPGALWKVPLPTGEPRRLGTIKADAYSAGFFPDGRRIVFGLDKDLYVSDIDGSNVGKLLTTAGGAGCPCVSPDGKQIVFITALGDAPQAIAEAAADGSGFHEILRGAPDSQLSCAGWTPDGKYLLYRIIHPVGSDIWTTAVRSGTPRRPGQPTQLTNGPLTYSGIASSRNGKQIYAIGTKPRGELVRYDLKTKQFVPFLGGISATHPSFSRDGQWVTYRSYSDHTLWRSRPDGTDRLQLTYPPFDVSDPEISQDGRQVAFQSYRAETYVISMDGGSPRKIAARLSYHGTLSPDGNSIVYSTWVGGNHEGLRILDLRNGTATMLPASQDKIKPFWIDQGTLVGATQDMKKLVTFDFKSGTWIELLASPVVDFMPSPDGKYVYYTTGGADPTAMRVRLADHKVETLTSLKGLRRVVDTDNIFTTQLSVAPDGSPVFTRDIGTQEIYALTVKWP